jgi:DNA-binding NtrC family response regulator
VKRPRWVLKWLPAESIESLQGKLRADLTDLLSLTHAAFAFPASFGNDTETRRAYLLRPHIEGSEILSATRGKSALEILPWLLSAAEALEILHRLGFTHGNVKASNFIVPRRALASRSRRQPQVILCDPAWWAEGKQPPEETAADLSGLGAVFHRILTGKEPKVGDSGIPELLLKPSAGIPIDLERVMAKLLHPDRGKPYRETSELIDDLRRLCGPRSPPPSALPDFFFDRKDELGRAIACFEQGPRALAVTAEAGMGKSAFVRRLALEAELMGYRTLTIRCYGENTASFSPLHTLLEKWVAMGHGSRSRYRRLMKNKKPEYGRRRLLRDLIDLFARPSSSDRALVIVDEAHLADSLTLEFLAGLVREIASTLKSAGSRAAPPSLLVSFRTESPFRARLRPLLEALSSSGDDQPILELPSLSAATVEEWLKLTFPGHPDPGEQIHIATRCQGNPFAIREAIRARGYGPKRQEARGGDLPSLHLTYLHSLGARERRILEALGILARPASRDLLGKITGLSGQGLTTSIASLIQDGTLIEERGLLFFQHGSFLAWMGEALSTKEKQAIHHRIASVLEKDPAEPVEEVAFHWLRSMGKKRGRPSALLAARRLAQNHEDRRALLFYQAVLDMPPLEAKVAEEAADAHSRAGEHRRAMAILSRLLKKSSGLEKGRLLGRMGVFSHRRGELSRAAFFLEKGLGMLAGGSGVKWLRERVRIQSEIAEISSNKGEYDRAESSCRKALEELSASAAAKHDAEIRREEMVLLETLAHLRLRRFRYAEARKLFGESLKAGAKLGAIPEKSLILNNLGTLHVQENRFKEAIGCYERAKKLSSRLGDDQSVSILESNLAVLHAKTGEAKAADAAIARAAELEARSDSSRPRFLRLHSSGIVDLCFGRYASAVDAFKAAIAAGEALEDRHMIAFDLVFLAECHLFRGEWKAARAALDRASSLGPTLPAPALAMVEARRALLAALRGDKRAFLAAWKASGEARREPVPPYLDAWNRVFLGWALRLLSQSEKAKEQLEAAVAFFSRVDVPLGEVHAQLELARVELQMGKRGAAERRLQILRSRRARGRAALENPMLSARLLLYQARLILDQDPRHWREAMELLAEAESYLIGRQLRDLEDLASELRQQIRQRNLESGAGMSVLPAPAVDSSQLSALQQAATDLRRQLESELADEITEEKAQVLSRHLESFEDQVRGFQRLLEKRDASVPAPCHASSILGRSAAIRKLSSLIRQVAPSSLPVLITGETGSGKELVARAIHGESPRRSAPLVSVNCAALPQELLESQLFGYSRGSFTGAEEDAPGLLRSADRGTFFFDEIGGMPLELQGKLLRVIDRGQVRPVGGSEEVTIDVRYLFATNRDLSALVEEGSFRQDLYYRLKAFEITVPPLRERLEDLPLLVEHFCSLGRGVLLKEKERESDPGDRGATFFDESALRALVSHPWPGNIRELENVVIRLVLTATGRVTSEDVRRLLGKAPALKLFSPAFLRSRPLEALLSQLEREYLLQLCADRDGDLEAVAAALGITVRALYNRFKRLAIRQES